jgi:3-oxoacyl-[acyl-carrier-protein] synthase-3
MVMAISGIKIRGTGRCVPQNRVTNDDLSRIVETSDRWIVSRTGIRTRHHCTTETHTELCVGAAKTALSNAGIQPEEVGALIVATITPDWLTPSAACLVQRALGLPEDTPCFDLNAACTGFLYGLHTMECLLSVSPRKYGLVIGCEVLSRLINWEDRSTCVLFGDGAGAVAVESREGWPSVCAELGARGNDRILLVPGPEKGVPVKISMEGAAVFKFAVEAVPNCMDRVLEKAGKAVDDVDFFVFHQANARIIDLAVRKYRIPPEKYYRNIGEYGNTSAASIPIVLSELWEQGRVRAGSRVLCVGFGGGLTWGGALVEFS